MGDDFHHKGAFFQMDAFAFYSGFGKPRPQPTTQGSRGFNFPIRDNYTFYLKAGTMGQLSEYMGDSIRFWKQLMSHPNYDEWWQARDARRAMYNIKPAMLVVGGLFDAEDCWGAWNLYKAIEKQSPNTDNRIVMGPWYHGQWASRDGSRLGNLRFGSNTALHYQNKIELPFFQYHLQQEVADPALPEASIFFTGSNLWKEFTQWPPASLETKPIYLHENGALSWTSGSAKAARSYASDPAHPVPYTEDVHFGRTREYMTDDQRFASRRPDVLTWETEILEEDLTLAGPVFANLMVSLSTTDADFVVKIIDVFPDNFTYPGENLPAGRATGGPYPMNGYQLLVRGEIMRGRFRNSFEKPEAFRPGKMEKVRFELPDVAHTFKKGHRLMIQVQSSWFPLADRNPQQFINIYEAKPDDFLKSDIKVFGSSSIELPILQE
jgi:putative CocE/NonD family hydrolase